MSGVKRKIGKENGIPDDENIDTSHGKSKRAKHAKEDVDLSQNPDFNVSAEAEVGIVEKVSVTNFMCHKKLEVSLGANVNFIIGRNGSGKSAILTGLIVGLGGKANMTHRGNSLKGFIKEGCSYCTVIVILRNRGSDAYKLEEYGQSIIIERRLAADGGGGYKIKSADGKVLSTKKEELNNILDQFNIQIDNPVSILTQDTARSFLNTSDPRDKYTFFLKATQLQQMSQDYQRIIEEKQVISDILVKKKQILPELARQVKEQEEKYKDMQQLENMKDKVSNLKKELVWALVNSQKKNVEEKEKDGNDLHKKIPAYQRKVDETCEKDNVMTNKFTEKKRELDLYEEEVTALIKNKTELHSIHKEKRKALRSAQDNKRKLERAIDNVKKDLKVLRDRIEEIKMSAQRDLESERAESEAKIMEKEKQLKEYKAKQSTSLGFQKQLQKSISNGKETKYKLKKRLDEFEQQIEKSKRKLVELENAKQNKLAVFGKSTNAILKAIKIAYDRGSFHKKPVGPIGSYLKLRDQRWALAIEICIPPKILTSYACHDGHDMGVLKEIFKKTCGEKFPDIILSSFSVDYYDVSRFRPVCPHRTVLDLLDLDNVIAHNTIVDQCRAEQILLIEEPEQAQQVIWFEKPKNTFRAITLRGHDVLGGRSTKIYPTKKTHSTFLHADVGVAIRQTEENLVGIQQQHGKIKRELTDIDVGIKRDTDEYNRTKSICSQHQDKINDLTIELQELKSMENEKVPDVFALEQEVHDHEEKRCLLEKKLHEADMTLEIQKDEVGKQEKDWNECLEKSDEAKEKLERLWSEVTALESELKTVKGHKKHYEEKLNGLMKEIGKTDLELQKLKDAYEKERSDALKYCDEVMTKRSEQSLESEIRKTEARIEREEKRRGNVEEVRDNYFKVLKTYEEVKQNFDNSKILHKLIDKALKRRARRYDHFQSSLTIRAKKYFEMLLSQRGYTGLMKINHDEETLIVKVNVENAQGADTKDSKALSGGERSFSTICFIMALWEAMEAPFRCLDEFDVFMDMLNRRISMNMLMKIAEEQNDRQFILLTPQDMSNVSGSGRVRIFKLQDPERGQQTISFQPT